MKIVAEKRTKTGTSASKQARAAGKLPAVIYGRAVESLPVLVDLKEFEDTVREVGSNGVFSLEVDGETYQVFVKEYSYFATKPSLYHIDLQAFTAGEKVDMTIPVYVEGEDEILEGILSQSISEIDIVIAPEDAPTHFTIDASKLEIGDSLTVADIELPESTELLTEPDETIVSVSAPEDISEDLETEDTATDVMPEPEVIGEDDEEEDE
ncbi:large subunit ribosomal protein L25 [Atopostipes suicloacalis DSM 15692]|uniref:Large ribosomal subunit protein bL25 n=1 Tax=Atopostipes suicloacalis DSM 15692 TaxID=1121025 RepID=A0A1M4Y4L9_9LACT|nr:50S ribosomal protein L25 [Atopostipes suicloacalis]SHF00620.1 large subunit ribosomal protein L25 [Atopostipes suicloacalis DSM 15692]